MRKLLIISLFSIAFMQNVSISIECPQEVITGSDENHFVINLTNDVPLTYGQVYLFAEPNNSITVTSSEWVSDQNQMYPSELIFTDGNFGSWFWGGGIGSYYEPDTGPLFDFTFTAGNEAQLVTITTADAEMMGFSETYSDLQVDCTIQIIDPPEPDVYLHFGDYLPSEGTLDIWIDTNVEIRGLQFTVTGFHLTSAWLGDEMTGFFMLSFQPEGFILMFGMEDYIPLGDHHFCTIEFDEIVSPESCFEDMLFADGLGGGNYDDYMIEDCLDTGLCDILADLNEDSIVDVLDIIIMVDCILNYDDCPCADIDGNGIIDILDVVITIDIILGG